MSAQKLTIVWWNYKKNFAHTVQLKDLHVQAKEVIEDIFGNGSGSGEKGDTTVKSKGFSHFFVDDLLTNTVEKFGRIELIVICRVVQEECYLNTQIFIIAGHTWMYPA